MDACDLVMSGYGISAEEAQLLEIQINKDPLDIDARTKLLGYYISNQINDSALKAKQRHVLWLIKNLPESDVLAHYGMLLDTLDAGYLEGKKAWKTQLKKEPNNLKILEHSAHYFLMDDRELAKEALEHARSLDMDNPKWPKSLGQLYSLETRRGSLKKKTTIAQKALEQYEIAYELSDVEEEQDALLSSLAKMALAANEFDKARKYAEKMLSQNGSGWNHGNNIHHGNLILGRIVFSLDNVEEAKRRLIKAGETPGSPQLDSFGPNMTLAKELLEKGEKEVVLEYFSLCSKFWKFGKTRLDQWSADVKDGREPDFSANLRY